MRAVTTLLITTALVSAPCAFAQSNNQYTGGDATAVTNVEAGWANDAGATAVASGNVVTTTQENNDTELTSTQHMDGDTSADANATVWTATGNVAITSAAVSNAGTATVVNGSSEIEAEQLGHGDANATVTLRNGYSHNAATSASASDNTAAVSAANAELRLLMDQESTGSVNASAEMDADIVEDQAVSGAVASANNLSVGGETSTILNATRQNAAGGVMARSDIYVGYATDASGNATANANSVTIDNQWGYVNAAIEQNSNAPVSADSYVTLGGDFTGFASVGAYGVGNQATVSNVGSDTMVDIAQSNGGDVYANAALDAGGGGGMALASSAAYGNSITGSLCTACEASGSVPGLYASSNQVNDGNVYSSSTINTTGANTIGAASTAIGNAATYSARPPGG